jgi:hypothetical protein
VEVVVVETILQLIVELLEEALVAIDHQLQESHQVVGLRQNHPQHFSQG